VKDSNSLAPVGDHRAPEALRPRPGFTAHLTGMSLTDLVRLQSLTEASGVFLVVSGERSGVLHFSHGQLFHAETREQRGDAAALEILAWAEGEFIRSERPPASHVSVLATLDSLLSTALGVTRVSNASRSMAATGIRRRGEARPLDAADLSVERAPSSPRDWRCASANGIDIPTMNRKAGNTTSTKLIASASAFMWRAHCGTPLTPASWLTKTITRIVRPRNASIERMRWRGSEVIKVGASRSGPRASRARGGHIEYFRPR